MTFRFFRDHRVLAFAGMIGALLLACAPSENTNVATDTSRSVQISELPPIPEMPLMPKSLVLDDIDFNSFSKDLAVSVGLKEGLSRGEAVDLIRLHFAPHSGEIMIKTSQSIFEHDDGAVLLFGASGFPDDSVKAEEIFIIVAGPKGAQTLGAYGARIKCYRGENTTEWQVDPCP